MPHAATRRYPDDLVSSRLMSAILSFIYLLPLLVYVCFCDVTVMSSALQSFLRAYTTYPTHLKHIFHIRSLHLGHTAKSFGLRDAPQGLSVAAGPSGPRAKNLSRKQNRSLVNNQKKAPSSQTAAAGVRGAKR